MERLRAALTGLRHSSWHDTAPVGVGDQSRFLNGAVVGETTLTARELLDRLLEIERERGRVRPRAGAARTLDLDLILYGDSWIDEPGLQVPHPRFRARGVVLGPRGAGVPGWADPLTGGPVSALLSRARRPS